MPNGNGNSQKNGKKKAPAKKKSNGNGQSQDPVSRAERAIGGAWNAAGSAYNKSQTARRAIWQGVPTGKNKQGG
jgi:hypothetical protein